MNKLDNLIVRALKTLNPERVQSVLNRFWPVRTESTQTAILRNRLAKICDEYNLITIQELVSGVEREQRMDVLMGSTEENPDYILRILKTTVQYAPITIFGPDYRVPLKFRRLAEQESEAA